ncbi:MAG: ISAs1 family transposase, partial [Gammaproteobacteria bacterium]
MHEAIQNVESIQLHFEELEDPRSTINRRHLLGDLIVISVMAVIAGADGPTAIGLWAENNKVWLKQGLELPHGIPSHDTFGRLLSALSPAAFQACFSKWIASVCEAESDGDPQQVAVDGKVLRR